MINHVEISCPVCYSTKVHILYSMDCEQAARHIFSEIKTKDLFQKLRSQIETLWQTKKCEVVQCMECQFVFANPYISGDSTFYALAYGDQNHYPSWKWDFQITYQTLQEMVRKGDLEIVKLLEIGAGDGAFVNKVASTLAQKENILCTEYSDQGANAINGCGIQCCKQDVRELNTSVYGGNFNVVCMFQVLEHMNDLDALFKQLTILTTEKANLFIAVPNSKQRAFYDSYGVMEDIPPTHIGRWNRRCFEIIGDRYGWRIEKHIFEPQSFISKVRRFVSFRFFRSRSANYLDRIHFRPLRRLIKGMLFCVFLLISFPAMIKLSDKELGVSQWVYLRKSGS